jgi:predicted S18 family serine protease
LLFVEQLGGTQTRLEVIDELAQKGDYASCLYEAALLHADLQAIASTLGVSSEEFEQLVDRKLNAAKTSVAQQIDQSIFPMAAYAYYELGRSVQESSPANALIYAEYALELSELDLYFEREPARSVVNLNFVPMVLFFLAGLIFGIVIGMSMRKRRPRKLRLR